jgi:hypothetical protein
MPWRMLVALLQLLSVGAWSGAPMRAGTIDLLKSVEIPFDFSFKPIAVWSGGALLAIDYARSAAPVVSTFDRNGESILRFTFLLPDVNHMQIRTGGFARGIDGSLALIGSAYDRDSHFTFLAWVSSNREFRRVIRLAPFYPESVTVAYDGTVWVAGREMVAGREVNPAHQILRRYDRTGKLLSSFLSRSDVGMAEPQSWHPAEKSRLFSSRDRVGWYSEVSNTYLDFLPDGSGLRRFPAATPDPRSFVHGFALCDNGNAFVSAQLHNEKGAVSGWKVFALDRQRGEWDPVPRAGRWGVLYGCDGASLVAQLNGGSTISWLATGR